MKYDPVIGKRKKLVLLLENDDSCRGVAGCDAAIGERLGGIIGANICVRQADVRLSCCVTSCYPALSITSCTCLKEYCTTTGIDVLTVIGTGVPINRSCVRAHHTVTGHIRCLQGSVRCLLGKINAGNIQILEKSGRNVCESGTGKGQATDGKNSKNNRLQLHDTPPKISEFDCKKVQRAFTTFYYIGC